MSESKRKLISIIAPVFNEEDNVAPFYRAVQEELAKIAEYYDYEFIFTDNRSQDQTFSRLKELARTDGRVRIVRFSRNFGYQKSIFTGYRFAKGDCAIELDCDLQDPPELLHDFIAKWKEGFEVVYGIRKSRKEGWLLTSARQWFYRVLRFLSDDSLPVDAGDFRLVDRKVLDQLKQLYDASPYLRGTIAGMGFNQIGIPYDRKERLRGHGKFSLANYASLAVDGVLNHSVVPLRFATFIGFSTVIALFGYIGGVFVLTLFFHYEWPRGFATLTVLILISISLNALFLGIIGEYLGRMYQQIKTKPIVVIDEAVNFENQAPISTSFPQSSKPEKGFLSAKS